MEIDFMFLWKSKVSDKRDLFSKVKDMLVQVFPDTQKDYISFIINNEIFKIPYKCSKGSDDSVYLKIECNQSDAKSAKILSAIREKICNGKHRKDFSIISTFDEASLSYCCRLMKPFGVFERRLRELMYLITVKAFGADWVEQSFPKDMINKIKEKTKGYITDDKITELAFELLDYGEIIDYLFSERRFGYTTEQIIDEELSDERLKSLSKEDIVQIVSKARKDTLWNKFFFNNKQLNFIEKERINSLRNYRNDIMHHHTINESKFQVIKKEINAVNKKLILAITDIEGKIYTNEEYGTVFSLIGNLTAGIIDGINKLFDERFFDKIKTIGTVLENMSEKMKTIFPDTSTMFTSDIMHALKPAFEPQFSNKLHAIQATLEPKVLSASQAIQATLEPKVLSASQAIQATLEPKVLSASQAIQATLEPKVLSASQAIQATLEPKVLSASQAIQATLEPEFSNTSQAIQAAIEPKVLSASQAIQATLEPKVLSASQAIQATLEPEFSNTSQAIQAAIEPEFSDTSQAIQAVLEPKLPNMSQSLINDTELNINSDILSDMEIRKEINNSDNSNE